jgi:dephospho-CoA kinase
MRVRKAVVFVGMPGSGKSVSADCAVALDVPVLAMGDVVREEATRRGLPHAPETLGRIMLELREKFGPSIVAERCITKFRQLKSPCVVIDGARSEAEIASFRKAVESVIIVAVHASPKVRFERLLKRARPDDAVTWETFQERDARELEVGLGRVIATADVMLINEGTVKNLKQRVTRLLKDELESKQR